MSRAYITFSVPLTHYLRQIQYSIDDILEAFATMRGGAQIKQSRDLVPVTYPLRSSLIWTLLALSAAEVNR